MTTSTDLARRGGGVQQAQDAALAIQAGQTAWDSTQLAALAQLGLKDAPAGDLSVFLHQSQRTGLDPFARQIYMIGRNEKKTERVNGQWVDRWSVKYAIQTGIDGYRVMRDRVKKRDGVKITVSRPIWYDHEGTAYKVWFLPEPPTACEITVTVDDVPYTSVLLYREYVQTKGEGDKRYPIAQWATKPAHMIEKCTEADAYRKAFPQDFSGVHLDDAMPAPDWDSMSDEELDARARAVGYRPRVTAEQLRDRRPQPATAAVVPDSSPAPAAPAAATAAPPPQQGAGEDPATSGASSSAATPDSTSPAQNAAPSPGTSSGSGTVPAKPARTPGASPGQVGLIRQHFKRLEYTDSAEDRVSRLSATAKLAGREGDLHTTSDLDAGQAARVLLQLGKVRDAPALMDLLQAGIAPEGEGDQ